MTQCCLNPNVEIRVDYPDASWPNIRGNMACKKAPGVKRLTTSIHKFLTEIMTKKYSLVD